MHNIKQRENMKAYHGDHALKERVMKELAEHREADRLVKGQYWENGKGCAVGCLIKCDDHLLYESMFGIPVELAYLEDRIFESLENHESQLWPERFMGAVNVGADLSKVHLRFMYWLLTDFQKLKNCDDESVNTVIDQCRTSVSSVAKLLNRYINDENVSEEEWRLAAEAAEAAAKAAWITDVAAEAGAWIAEAAEAAAEYAAEVTAGAAVEGAWIARTADTAGAAAEVGAWAVATTAGAAAYAAKAADIPAWEAAAKAAKAAMIAMSNKLIELIKECEGEKEHDNS